MQSSYPTHEDILKAKIMDATIICMMNKGIDKTRIGDVAQQMGVSRQTIYNYFANKNLLFDAVFSREAVTLAASIAGHIATVDSLEEKFTQAFLYAIEAFPQNPVLRHIITSGGRFLQETGHSRERMQAFGELVLHQVFEDNPQLREDSAEICELLSRNIISFLVMPDPNPRSSEELADFVRRRLLPGLGIGN